MNIYIILWILSFIIVFLSLVYIFSKYEDIGLISLIVIILASTIPVGNLIILLIHILENCNFLNKVIIKKRCTNTNDF